jgi:hypothetical protein
MSRVYEENVLLGALLARLGNTQAQAPLVRLEQWLTRDGETPARSPRFERDRIRTKEAPYDRRKRDGNGIHKQHSQSAS